MLPAVYKKVIYSNVRIIYTLAETRAGVHSWQLICILPISNFHAFWGVMRLGLLVLPFVLFFVTIVAFALDLSLVPAAGANDVCGRIRGAVQHVRLKSLQKLNP